MKPILFNTEMIRAIQENRKTVTRRVVKFQAGQNPAWTGYIPDGAVLYGSNNIPAAKAPYQPGDILWVRETWQNGFGGTYIYKAGAGYDLFMTPDGNLVSDITWRPSIHMPKEAARLFLRVTGVRVERLQDGFFTQGDTIAALYDEGIDIGEQCRQCIENYGNPCCNDLDPELEPDENGEDKNGGSECGMLDEVRSDFARLWDSTIKPADLPLYGWAANPWVWVIEFERISKEAAQREEGQDG